MGAAIKLTILFVLGFGSPGWTKPKSRTGIIGGDVSLPQEHPYLVSVQLHNLFGDTHVCGGTILNENHVLTAARCVKGHGATAFKVVAGEHNLQVVMGTEQTLSSEAIFKHDYSTVTNINDLAIIKTAGSFVFEEGVVEPVQLPDDYQELTEGSMCTAIGWGLTEISGETTSNVPHRADLPYVTDEECRSIYGDDFIMMDSLCAGYKNGTEAVCTGDEGGPLMCDGVQAGIISWWLSCSGEPAVFAQVSHFLDFIRIHMDA